MGLPLKHATIYTFQFVDGQAVLAGDRDGLEYIALKNKYFNIGDEV